MMPERRAPSRRAARSGLKLAETVLGAPIASGLRVFPSGFGQQKAKRRRCEQRAAQNYKRNGDAAGLALQFPDNARAKITADVAQRVHQADDRAGGRARQDFRGNGKERRQSRKRSRNRQTQKCVGKPEGMFLEQNARDEGHAAHGINEGGVTAPLAGQVGVARSSTMTTAVTA